MGVSTDPDCSLGEPGCRPITGLGIAIDSGRLLPLQYDAGRFIR